MSAADGTVLGTTKILDNGSPAERWNLVLVSEGYQSTQMTQFAGDAQQFVNALVTMPPFDEFEPAINVYRVDVTSTDSGADDPAACGGSGATVATYFDASFCNGGIRRLLNVNAVTVQAVVNAQVTQWHAILVLVNSPIYGGSGGAVGTFSLAPGANEIALHELGHLFGLADEYDSWAGCGVDTGHDNHPAVEPAAPNVTIDSNRATIKWRDLILATTPVPTTSNPNCAFCDSQPSPVAPGTVGAFEGAHYYHCDCYRPEFNCKMRALGQPFCAVCRRRIRQTLKPYMPRLLEMDIFEAWRLVARRIIRRRDWIIDPAPWDLIRWRIRDRVAQVEGHPAGTDDLSSVLERIDEMDAAELRASLLEVKTGIARLDLAARMLQARLDRRRG